MNDFTKEELEDLMCCVKDHNGYERDPMHENLIHKIQCMIDDYSAEDPEKIFSGQVLFPSKVCASGILEEIEKHIDLCENSDRTKIFRIDWKIFQGELLRP